MKRRGAAVLALAVTGVLPGLPGPMMPGSPAGLARAEHQVSYRYVVLGYVVDAENRGRRGVRVELSGRRPGSPTWARRTPTAST